MEVIVTMELLDRLVTAAPEPLATVAKECGGLIVTATEAACMMPPRNGKQE